ncbi:MAG: methionine synthase, partial [Gammaproteobacteria bacterium]|nr:methionine synthase [Gammaproteobacteria bacterium]
SNRAVPDWKEAAVAPSFIGTRVFDIPLEELVDFIDWMPFFNAWEFHGKFPAILEDDIVGEAASNLYRDARAMLDRIIDEKWLQSKAVVGLFPANAVEDDIVLFADEARSEELATLHQLRQQRQLPNGQPNLCLADFVAPRQSGIADHIGAFAVTAGIGIEKHVAEFEGKHDDYNAILLKALADRLAEASAEYMHAKVRKELWGYASDESLNNDALIAEGYRGIRPAPGYPACPDHMEKTTLWNLLDVEKNVGIELTDSFAMYPAASVSGWYLAHPEAKYFQVGKIGRDQAEDYARRKGISLATVERWLASNLGYDAAAA